MQIPVLRREIRSTGATYGYQLLESRSNVAQHPYIASAMLLNGSENLVYCHSSFTADGQPYCCKSRWVNGDLAPGLDCATLTETSANELLARNVTITRGTVSICVSAADDKCAGVLGVRRGSPLLVIERILWNGAAAITLSRQHFPPHYRLTSAL